MGAVTRNSPLRFPAPNKSRRVVPPTVDMVLNPCLIQRFEEKQKEYKRKDIPSQPILGFHATPLDTNIESICTENFDPSRVGQTSGDKGYYGAGVYFSMMYDINYSVRSGRYIMCLVLPGKRAVLKEVDHGCKLRQGFQSHQAIGGLSRFSAYKDELVIFDKDQIIP